MPLMPSKVQSRLLTGLKKFQPIVSSARTRDINESDTVVIITDLLSEMFGFDKYSEITSEQSIKKTFCDLAIKIDGKMRFLIEVKAAGIDLKDDHIRQAVDYGSNSGVDWVVLTNGVNWKLFKIIFGKPVSHELVFDFDLTQLNAKKELEIEMLYYLCKESIDKSHLYDYHNQKQSFNRFFVGQLLLSAPIIESIRKTLKKISPDIKITSEGIYDLLKNEVIKRDVLECDKAEESKKRLQKYFKQLEKDNLKA